jgi:hypothetical protein
MIAVPFADHMAKDRWALVLADQRQMLDSEVTAAGLADRLAENTIKLATIRAISRNAAEPTVAAEDLEWAWAFMHQSMATVTGGVARYMAASEIEAYRLFGGPWATRHSLYSPQISGSCDR